MRGEEGESPVVCYEEEGVECAIAKDGCCCAYAVQLLVSAVFSQLTLSPSLLCCRREAKTHL